MHPSTTAIITATEYTNGIFLQIHMFRFLWIFASTGMHGMTIIILHLWGFKKKNECREILVVPLD